MKAYLVLKLVISITAILALAGASIGARILIEVKLRKLLSGEKSITRFTPFFIINPATVPKTQKGLEFLAYGKTVTHIKIVVFIAAALVLFLSMVVAP